jgi:hypothetical protein
VLAEQPAVEVHAGDAGAGAAGAEADARGAGAKVSASELAALVTGTYDSLWGRTRLAVIGDRLFSLDGAAADPASSALELSVGAVRPDPIDPSLTAVELWTWGDPGYGSWSEPILARLALDGEGGAPRCVGLVVTGQVQTPSAEFVMPERVTAP